VIATTRRPLAAIALLVVGGALLGACQEKPLVLTLDDLTPAERSYVRRFVILERARAVALAQPARGDSLLDSLAVAWGPDALSNQLASLSRNPRRLAALEDLLARILAAERDSLVQAPLPRRLAQPLPRPKPTLPRGPRRTG
jgi:ribosomal 50S subunit-associated protein YjgA (DUF615 family)